MITPIKTILRGENAAHHLRFAQSQLAILERQMSFQGLNEGRRVVSPYAGVVVECLSKFGHKEVRIYVQPVPQQLPLRPTKDGISVSQAEEIELREDQYLFYVRIESAEIHTDRIILYKMQFNGSTENPPLYNSNNNFTPGMGTVLADVDLLTEELLYPVGLSVEDSLVLVGRVTTLAAKIPSNAFPSVGLKSVADDWYVRGPLWDVGNSAVTGEYTFGSPGVYLPSIYLSEGLDVGSGVKWWFLTDPVPTGDKTAWKAKWSPLFGGDTRIYVDAYPLEDFKYLGVGEANYGNDDVSIYYGKYALPYIEDTNPATIVANSNYGAFWTPPAPDVVGYVKGGSTSGEGDIETDGVLVFGDFYTAINADGASSFFIVGRGFAGDSQRGFSVAGIGYSVPEGYEVWVEYECDGHYNYSTIQLTNIFPVVREVVTPLEIVETAEYRTDPKAASTCSEMIGTYWDRLISCEGWITLDGRTAEQIGDGGVNDAAVAAVLNKFGSSKDDITNNYLSPIHARQFWKNINPTVDTMRISTLFVLDEPVRKGTIQSKLCSLFYMDETIVVGKSYVSTGERGSSTAYQVCDGVYTLTGKDTVTKDVGVIVYIFAPQEVYREEMLNEEVVKTYWDIHSARVSPDRINPYRCLALEEYLLTVFSGIQDELDANGNIAKMPDTTISFAMDKYGYTVRTGFV